MAGNNFAFLMILAFAGYLEANEIPAVLWTNDNSVQYPVSLAGHTLDADDFYNGYLQQLAENGATNIAVFVQDQLSIDDITRYADVFNDESQGAVYKSLRGIMEEYESTHLPSVKEPVNAVDKLLEHFQGTTILVDNAEDVKNLKLKDGEVYFIIVNLPKTTGGGKLQAVVESDEIMGTLTEQLSALRNSFYAVYTAKARSKQIDGGDLFKGRQLLQAEAANYTFFNLSNCVYVYFTEMKLNLMRVAGDDIPYDKRENANFTFSNFGEVAPGTESTCSNGSAFLDVTLPPEQLPTNMRNFRLKMNFKSYMRYWYIEKWSLTFDATYNEKNFNETDLLLQNTSSTLFGVVGYPKSNNSGTSYYCQSQPPIKQADRSDKAQNIVELTFSHFQLQYDIRNFKFSDADDCVGFFTIPIWMGLISVLVFTLILAFGIALLANINTMDRFDDPKGKPIQVNTSD